MIFKLLLFHAHFSYSRITSKSYLLSISLIFLSKKITTTFKWKTLISLKSSIPRPPKRRTPTKTKTPKMRRMSNRAMMGTQMKTSTRRSRPQPSML